jgi:ferrous iron transport protein A
MSTKGWTDSEPGVCNPDWNGRILKSDQSGRSLSGVLRGRLLSFRPAQGVRRVSVLSELKIGECGVLVALDLPESVQNHLMHMGFVPDALVTALRRAPAGDPTVYGIDGMEIALRHETADSIRVRLHQPQAEPQPNPVATPDIGTPELAEARR